VEALQVLAQMVRAPRFDAAELEREREVVLEEIRGGDDDVGLVVGEATWAAAFPHHGYGRSVIGTVDSVRSLPRDGLLRFHKENYSPANARVVVAGRFDAGAVTERVAGLFSGGGSAPTRTRRRATWGGAGTTLVRRRFDTRLVRVVFDAPAHTESDAAACDVLACTLGGGSAAPVVAQMRTEPGVFGASVEYEAEARGGLLVFEAHVAEGAVQGALDRLTGLVAEAHAGRIDSAEMARARVNLAASRLARHESVDGRATDAASSLAHLGSPEGWRDYDARMAATTPEQVRALAARMLAPDRARLVALAPRVRALAPRWRAGRAPPSRPAVRRVVLDNGLRILFERDASPLCAVQVVGMGGQLAEERDLAGRCAAWSRTAAKGAGGLSTDALGRALAGLAAGVSASSGRSSQALRLDLPATAALAGVELLLHVLVEPAFPDEEVRLAREALAEAQSARDDDPDGRLALALAQAAFGEHPWALDPIGDPESIARLDAEALRALHARWAQPSNLVISVVGEVDEEAIEARLRRVLGGKAAGQPVAVPQARVARGSGRVTLGSRRDQALISMLFGGMGVRDRRRPALDVLVELLSGQSGRLFTELREQEGLAYEVGAWSVESPAGGFVGCGLGTDPGRLDEAEARLLASIARIRAGEIDDEHVLRARTAVVGSVESGFQTAAARAAEMAYAELYLGRGVDYRAHAARARSVQPGEVRSLAASIFRRPAVVGRLGPREPTA
jgi:zinc protease